jgi:hypothetical protein
LQTHSKVIPSGTQTWQWEIPLYTNGGFNGKIWDFALPHLITGGYHRSYPPLEPIDPLWTPPTRTYVVSYNAIPGPYLTQSKASKESKALPKRRQAEGKLCGLELVPALEHGSSCDSKRCQPNQAPSWDTERLVARNLRRKTGLTGGYMLETY